MVDATIPPLPASAPWHAVPDEPPDRPTRGAERRYGDAAGPRYAGPADAVEQRYADPADADEHRYADPAEEIDRRYPDPADEIEQRYAEPADDVEHRYAEPVDDVEHRYPDPADDGMDRRYPEPVDEVARRYPDTADRAPRRYAEPAEPVGETRRATSAPAPASTPAPAPEAPVNRGEPRAADSAAEFDRKYPDQAEIEADPAYINPVDGLVHAAVADRPLEEVIELIELLEQSPEYARATVDALRAVGTDRSVEDVSRLVALLTRPPRNADSADEAIRAAAEGRPVEDVTRLMALLHRPPLEPHCGEAAVRAAATSRPVDELVELIGRMAHEQGVREGRQRTMPATREEKKAAEAARATAKEGPPSGDRLLAEGGTVAIGRTARARRNRPARTVDSPAWPRLAAALLLVVCGLAHFPPHRDGASLSAYGFVIGACGLCVLLGLALLRRSVVPVLALGIVVPATLAVAQLLEGRVRSAGLSRALDLTLAPPWLAGLTAVLAALAALTALVSLLASSRPRPRPDVRQLAGQPAEPDRAAAR
ncbi:hypothetical protein [Streptomyces sp. DSM 40484]|uniref:hypothetical protein n=1 Tax=Streptomyces kroppenstedtii TaxID=3051181 RepID=UPI0028D11593|nr:hypothetical protein [Streptomyces sp. DSM 40484]